MQLESFPTALTPSPRAQRWIIALLLVVSVLWGVGFIWRCSFVFQGERYFLLFDDALISMTYAQNLVRGEGLRWSVYGPPVEGFSHPLWLVPMIVAQVLPPRLSGLPVQVLSLLLLMANTIVVARLTNRHFAWGRHAHGWLAAAGTALFFPLAYWALIGMESAAQALLLSMAVLVALDIVRRGEAHFLTLWVLAGLMLLLRIDMLPCAALLVGYVAWNGELGVAERRRAFIRGALLFAAMVGSYEVFRLAYYGELLPNTYYLKMGGIPRMVRILRGLHWARQSFEPMWEVFAVVAIGTLWAARRRPHLLLPPAFVVGYIAYSIWVGGDAYEGDIRGPNRFVAWAFPMFFVSAAALFNCTMAWLERVKRRAVLAAPALGVASIVVLFVYTNHLDAEPGRTRFQWRKMSLQAPPNLLPHELSVLMRLVEVREHVPDDSRVAVTAAGIWGYFSRYELIDLLGYNDHDIARGPLRRALSEDAPLTYWPGHEKHGLELVLARDRPDVIVEPLQEGDAVPSMQRAGYVPLVDQVWIRADARRRSEAP